MRCTSSRVRPVVDLTVAAAATGSLYGYESQSHAQDNSQPIGLAVAALAFAIAVPYAIAATYGFDQTSHCRHAQSLVRLP